jgi:anaerobic ribonucleoside-triphosphate reductase activating protein
MAGVLLNVADIRHRSRVNGPGARAVVWVQGCTIGCPGCFNPHTHPHRPVRLIDPAALGRRLARVPGSAGLTIAGGEPFEQAQACAILAATVQARERSVMVFSGYTYACLHRSAHPAVREFLAAIDILVAGPYVARRRGDGTGWRGSTNQTVHGFTERGRQAIAAAGSGVPVIELATDGVGLMSTGFPAAEDQQWLDQLGACAGSSPPTAKPSGVQACVRNVPDHLQRGPSSPVKRHVAG